MTGMIAEMSAQIDALQARVAALEAAARNNAPPGMPQIGEVWRMRGGGESGVLLASDSDEFPLRNDYGYTFTAAGRHCGYSVEHHLDLVSRISAAHVEPPPADHIADAGEMWGPWVDGPAALVFGEKLVHIKPNGLVRHKVRL